MRKQVSLHLGIMKMNFRSLFLSKSFYAAIIAILFFMYTTLLSENADKSEITCVCDGFMTMVYFDLLPKLVILISAMPVVTSFCTDWNTQYIRFSASRMGVQKYARHKVFLCMAGTFITAFVSLFIFTLLLLTEYPILSEMGISNLEPIYPFGCIVRNAPFLYQMLRITCFSSYCSMWSVVGLALSAFMPNRFLVMTSPFIIAYIFEALYYMPKGFPTWLQIPFLSTAAVTTPMSGNPLFDFLYIIFLFMVIGVLIGEIFVYGAKERLKNEIV